VSNRRLALVFDEALGWPAGGCLRSERQAMLKRVSWTVVVPLVALVVLALTWGGEPGPVIAVLAGALLVGSVLAAVHHAEVVAHRVGEPLGSLVLAVAVTIIEVALIVELMASGGNEAATLARDTAFGAVMITTNGIAGLSLLLGSRRYGVTLFHAEGSGAALATLTTLATLSLVLPTFTTSHAGPEFSPGQLIFAAVASLSLYLMFVFTQTVRHRDFFLPVAQKGQKSLFEDESHAEPPSTAATLRSLGLLLAALVAVVGLAEQLSPTVENLVAAAGFPHSFVGVLIAALVLLPETLAAGRAARQGRIQTSLNLAYGSAMASIGLTIPAIALASIWLKGPLVLGLGATQLVLFTLTVVISVLTVVPGRATRLQGELHLVLLAAYVFLAIIP
jgi:Ca2+:H+ antiporter